MPPAPAGERRALVIARNLPPLRGGIERLMEHTVRELAQAFRCDVIGPRGCARVLDGVADSVELPAGVAPFLARAALRLALRPVAPYAVCLASNGLMAPLARLAARKARCPYVVWLHGLDLTYAHPAYRAAFLPSIRRADRVVANSAYTAALARGVGVAASRIEVLHPGVEVAAPVAASAARAFAERRGLAGHPLMLFVGRLVERKGVVEFVERVLPQVLRAQPAARLLVVGGEPGHAGRASGPYRERIVEAAQRTGVAAAVQLAGELPDDELLAAYAAADVLVFPALERPGDVEGFGMVMVEAAAQGTPTVAFAAGGIPDAVSPGSGVLLPPGDEAGLARALVAALGDGLPNVSEQSCREHARRYDWAHYGERVRALCRDAARSRP